MATLSGYGKEALRRIYLLACILVFIPMGIGYVVLERLKLIKV